MLAWEAWRALEADRLGTAFTTPRDYALNGIVKCPEQPALRNVLVNVRTFGAAAGMAEKPLRYPRERLFHALSLLLWDDLQSPVVSAAVRHELHTQATDFAGLVHAYEQLWHRFN